MMRAPLKYLLAMATCVMFSIGASPRIPKTVAALRCQRTVSDAKDAQSHLDTAGANWSPCRLGIRQIHRRQTRGRGTA